MLCAAWGSVAETAIAPMQDFLNLGSEARMNFPGTVGGNWLWRMQPCDYARSPVQISEQSLTRGLARNPAQSPAQIPAQSHTRIFVQNTGQGR